MRGSWRPTRTATLLAITAFLSRCPGLLNRGPGGPASLRTCSSIQHLISNSSEPQLQQLNRGTEGPLCWVLAFSTPSCPTDWISCALSYIIVHVHLLLVGVTNCSHSNHPRSRLYSAIPASVIYTGAFSILTAWLGRRSIYNKIAFFICKISMFA